MLNEQILGISLSKLLEGYQKIDRSKIDRDGWSLALMWAYDLFFDHVLHTATFKCMTMAEGGPIMA